VSIIDDSPIFRRGLFCVLGEMVEFDIVACLESFSDVEERCLPDVFLIHLATRKIDEQTQHIKKIRKNSPHVRILLISEYSDADYLMKVMESGCDGYVQQNVSEEVLRRVILNLNSGSCVFDRRIIDKFIDILSGDAQMSQLSQREVAIIELIAEGRSNEEIALEIGLSTGTIKNAVSNMLQHYRFKKRAQLTSLLPHI
jgi:DNA-binding NarL/FixJ family response regulator